MSDPLPPEFDPAGHPPWTAPATALNAPATALEEDKRKAKAPAWRSWVAAGVVTAAFAGGAAVAISIVGGSDDSPTAQPAAAADEGADSGDGPGFSTRLADRGARGTITAIEGTTLTLDSTDESGATSTVTVETTDTTTFREAVEGTVADLAVGDKIVAMGTATDDGVTAANIVDNGDEELVGGFRSGGPPPANSSDDETPRTFTDGGPGPGSGMRGPGGAGPNDGGFAAGTITSIDGAQITVEVADGSTVVVSTTSDTTVSVNKSITLADLAVGDTVTATGTTDGDTVTADVIQKGELATVRGFAAPDGRPPQSPAD